MQVFHTPTYIRRMKAWFRDVLAALQGIREALGGIAQAAHAAVTSPVTDEGLAARVAALELEMEKRHAEAEGLLLRAQGKFNAARAAEERARRYSESAQVDSEGEEDLDEEQLLQAYEEVGLHLGDDGGGEEDGLYAVPSRMETRRSSKRNAHAAKFGGPR